MIEINHIEVFNFEGAFRGLRNAYDSWDNADSKFGVYKEDEYYKDAVEVANTHMHSDIDEENDKIADWLFTNGTSRAFPHGEHASNCAFIGENDLKLAQRMIAGGHPNDKFMRQIFVSMDINAPFLWWKEMDTYKVATTANSCSTMHKLTSYPITEDCFSFDEDFRNDLKFADLEMEDYLECKNIIKNDIKECEHLRQMTLLYKEKSKNETFTESERKHFKNMSQLYWRLLIQKLPSGWNQKRTWTGNYQTLQGIYKWRKYHPVCEWVDFCKMIEQLPYGKELICFEKLERGLRSKLKVIDEVSNLKEGEKA